MPEELERDILAILGLDRLPPPRAPDAVTHARQPSRPPRPAFAPAALTWQAMAPVMALTRSRTASASLVGAGTLALAAGVVFLISRVPDRPDAAPAPSMAGTDPSPTAPLARARNEAVDESAPRSLPITRSSPMTDSAPIDGSRPAVSSMPTTPQPSLRHGQAVHRLQRQADRPRPASGDELATRVTHPIAIASPVASPSSGPEKHGKPPKTDEAANVVSSSVSAPTEQLASSYSAPVPSPAPRESARRSRNDNLDRLRTLRRQW